MIRRKDKLANKETKDFFSRFYSEFLDNLYDNWNFWLTSESDIEDFKDYIEKYSKEHPDAEVSAWAFRIHKKGKEKPEAWEFKSS